MRVPATIRRLLSSAPVAAGALVLLAGPVTAAAPHVSVTSSGGAVPDGAVLTSNDVLHLRGQLDAGTGSTSLVVRAPGESGGHAVAQGSTTLLSGSKTLSFDLNTECLTYDPAGDPCDGYRPAPNGLWTVALQGGENESTRFSLRVPPAVVQGVSAVADGSSVTVGWQPGVEPDLRSYAVDQDGQPVVSGLDPAQVCRSGEGCAVTVDLGPGAAGTHSFVVRSARAVCPGCADTLASADSRPATVAVRAPSAPGAGSGPGGASAGGAAADGHGSGARRPSVRPATAGEHAALARTFTTFNPTSSAAGPPPGPSTLLAPLPEGTYKPQLAYPSEQTARERVRAASPRQQMARALADIADNAAVWRPVAGALVLLLLAAHLRAWLHRPHFR